jgi:hypothetical protein
MGMRKRDRANGSHSEKTESEHLRQELQELQQFRSCRMGIAGE